MKTYIVIHRSEYITIDHPLIGVFSNIDLAKKEISDYINYLKNDSQYPVIQAVNGHPLSDKLIITYEKLTSEQLSDNEIYGFEIDAFGNDISIISICEMEVKN